MTKYLFHHLLISIFYIFKHITFFILDMCYSLWFNYSQKLTSFLEIKHFSVTNWKCLPCWTVWIVSEGAVQGTVRYYSTTQCTRCAHWYNDRYNSYGVKKIVIGFKTFSMEGNSCLVLWIWTKGCTFGGH